jgi:hypothetical protein
MAKNTVTLNTREVAQEAREFARENGMEVGTRGRLSRDIFVDYFLARPRRAREIARQAGIPISARGRLSPLDADRVTTLVR